MHCKPTQYKEGRYQPVALTMRQRPSCPHSSGVVTHGYDRVLLAPRPRTGGTSGTGHQTGQEGGVLVVPTTGARAKPVVGGDGGAQVDLAVARPTEGSDTGGVDEVPADRVITALGHLDHLNPVAPHCENRMAIEFSMKRELLIPLGDWVFGITVDQVKVLGNRRQQLFCPVLPALDPHAEDFRLRRLGAVDLLARWQLPVTGTHIHVHIAQEDLVPLEHRGMHRCTLRVG